MYRTFFIRIPIVPHIFHYDSINCLLSGHDGGAAEAPCGGLCAVVSPLPYWLTTALSGVCCFCPKDIYLGELMSTVCSVHVGGWAGVGACSAEGVGDPGRIRRRAARDPR